MAAKNRWNSQRFLERIPEAELEWKMTVYRKDLQRFQRNQRMERTKLWNLLFRNSRELNDSIVARYSMNDVLSRRVSVDELKKIDIQQQSPTAIVESMFRAIRVSYPAALRNCFLTFFVKVTSGRQDR
jgi:hypothetical protein